MSALNDDQIRQALRDLEGWEYDGQALTKTYRFSSFLDAVAFIDRLAPRAEEADHHPELTNVYNRVDVRLRTHDADAVTQKDVDLARQLEEVA